MRVLMFSAIFPPAIGGPSTQCFNLCKALAQKDIDPIVVTYHESKKFSVSNIFGFKVYYFKSIYTKTFFDKFIRWAVFPFYIFYILKKEKIDILHCHSVSVLSFIAGLIAKIFSIPRIIKFAGDWVWETLSTKSLQAKDFKEIYKKSLKAKFMVCFEKMGLKIFNKIWVVSEFRKGNINYLLGTVDNVIVINNCLLLEGGGAQIHKKSDLITIISANRFIPHKRIAFMVELFAEMNIPNSRLILVGGGDQKEIEIVKEAIRKFRIEDKVKMVGILPIEEVYKLFSRASFYISTSIEEGFPNVFIEAMHYGLPVIATDDGGSMELILDKETGYIFTPNDHERILEAMRYLATDTSLLNEMSHKAFERSKSFDLELRIDDFVNMYKDLLK